MKYKISDSPLKLREYGRNIQAMVEYVKQIEDREVRTKLAHEIVRIMSNLHPQVREVPDYKQKLWDHLFMISGFDLDVEAPYPMPDAEELMGKPQGRMEYYRGKSRYRQYGWNVQLMIRKAVEMPEGKEKKDYINLIANTMKMFLRSMDRETTPEEIIAEHINEISKGKLNVRGEDLTFSKVQVNFNKPNHGGSNNNKKGRGGKKYSNRKSKSKKKKR